MNNGKSVALCVALLSGWVAPATGGVAESISVSVVPILSPAVATYSAATTGFTGTVGYQVDVRNVGRNTNNNIRFTAETYVTDAAEFGTYEFDSADGAPCTASKGPVVISIECALGTLSSGQRYPTFYLFFKSPRFVGNGIADGAGQDFVTFNHKVYYAEGGNGPKSTPRNGFTATTAAPPTVLGTPDPTLVRSVVLARGGTYFTGMQGIASTLDVHATRSVVPPLAAHTTAEIVETAVGGNTTSPCTGNVVTCYTSQITIPGSFAAPPYLTSRITQAIENIRPQVAVGCPGFTSASNCLLIQPVPIDQIIVTYLADVTPTNPSPSEQVVGLCSPPAGPPPAGMPCITSRTVVTDALGKPLRYEWTLISVQNGRLAIR